jgi:predicted adenine nucleotide alpha hydrolase (AANH) superfamily ATPase
MVPMRELIAEGHEVEAAFVNPNIHPYQEFERRLEAARASAADAGVRIVHEDPYGLVQFLREVAFHENERCPICYRMRLGRTAELARSLGHDAFTTTMLVSTQQDHDAVRAAGEAAALAHGVGFAYRDLRPRVMQGVRASKERGLYRQQYCGCVYSEWERHRRSP